ncbi:hypothetical protein FA95DRAFT_1616987 [Auriscalpium vulgare]|uniref:Uncharacterized protein n=1 Tax=Auriscalpium vulgare TaxID=40419 RepID=A0ACB8S860_9AGAM|nr:hypothetical protein FA95DRAFT_1616987 [Auriscalpium vulgare]
MVEEWVVTHMDYWVLDGCTFKLSRYATHLLWSKELASFLASQPSLREFQFFGGTTADSERVDVPDHALPRCNVLRVSAHMLPDFKARRNITHLRVDMFHNNAEEEKRMAKCIKRYGHTLNVLALVRRVGWEEYLSIPSMLKHFIEHTPQLVCLAMYDTLDFSQMENKKILKLMSQNLRKLQVLIWAPLHDGHHMDDDVYTSEEESGFSADSDSDEDSKSKVDRYAHVVMAAMPSLKYFISMRDRGIEGWLRDAQGHIIRHIPPMPALENCYASVNPQEPLEYFLRPGFLWTTESLDMTERYYLPYDMPTRRTTVDERYNSR